MPTELHSRRPFRLTVRQHGTAVVLLMRVRFLNWHMERVSARLSEQKGIADSAALLVGARKWVELHTRLADLFGLPLPESVAELRDLFLRPQSDGSTLIEPPGVPNPTAPRPCARDRVYARKLNRQRDRRQA
jgi:hypothetical protein